MKSQKTLKSQPGTPTPEKSAVSQQNQEESAVPETPVPLVNEQTVDEPEGSIAKSEAPVQEEEPLPEPEEDKPSYGTKRYEIVDQVLYKMEEKARRDAISPVQQAAMKAQSPYKTMSMKDLGDEYQGPSKYLSQRDAPLEIPPEVVKKLFQAMDQDLDDRISLKELLDYVHLSGVPIPEETVVEIFQEASSQRPLIHEAQRNLGLTIQEIEFAVRGRFRFVRERNEWDVYYRPFRDYWILLLLTQNERLFALQVPKVVPGRIRAQYEEQEEIAAMKASLQRGEITFKKAEGIDRRYQSIREERKPMFTRVVDKPEAGVVPEPDGSIVFALETSQSQTQAQAYEKVVNGKVTKVKGQNPKFTFESRELYDQAQHLCQMIPHWNKESDNPIYQYVCESERPF